MMVSLNQVRLVYNIHTTLNPIMNDECYYKAGKCLVGLYSVYNIHTRLNPMMNATTQLENSVCGYDLRVGPRGDVCSRARLLR